MKEITLNNKEYKLIPIDKSDDIMFDDIEGRIMSFHKGYKKIGRISDILKDEDICKGLVGLPLFKYDIYNNGKLIWIPIEKVDGFKWKATDSFLSYLISIKLYLTKEYLLIQKT